MLTEQTLTLLDPQTWDDRNDSFYLNAYREKKGFKTVLALCFTEDSETYHHWSVFAPGSGGVCIEFKRKDLIDAVNSHPDIQSRAVRYLKMTRTQIAPPRVEELPFLKRWAFRHESEFRMVYTSASEKKRSLNIPISLALIARVTLSPWLPNALSNHVKKTLRAISGCGKLGIVRSTLISNQVWKNLGEQAN